MGDLSRIRGLKAAREFLGLSLRELSLLIPPDGARKQEHISKSLVCAWQNGAREMSQTQINVVARLIANKVTDLTGREIGVKITNHSPWKVSPWGWCRDCHRLFRLPTFRARRCERCVRKGKQ